MPDGAPLTLRVVRCGTVAARLFGAHTPATVAAVFDRSFYVESGSRFACIGSNAIGDGPLNAIVSEAVLAPALSRLRPGLAVALPPSTGIVCICFDPSSAAVWQPPIWPAPPAADDSFPLLTSVRKFAISNAPHDGLARLVLDIRQCDEPVTHFLRVAFPRFKAFENWLADALRQTASDNTPPPVDLLGLGPGLTPSGDDVIGGVMVALDALAEHALRDRIAHAVHRAAPRLTSQLSAAFLSAAAEGIGSAALHDFIAAVIRGDDDARVLAAAQTLAATGHTSGWDAMAGAMLALDAHRLAQSR